MNEYFVVRVNSEVAVELADEHAPERGLYNVHSDATPHSTAAATFLSDLLLTNYPKSYLY